MVAEWFGSLGDERVAVETEDVRSMNDRLTWMLRRSDDGSWKIVHEHTSAPADFETAKVMLQRRTAVT